VGFCVRRLAVLACLLAPRVLPAQLAPVGVPAGVLRVDLDGALESWDHRWLDGSREPLGADVSSAAAGADLFPSLGEADARIGRITGVPDFRLNLGVLTTDAEATVGRGTLGLALGLTRSLTVFGRIPLVEARVQSAIRLDPAAANAGFNPGADQEAGFFQELDASLAALGGRIAAGDFDGDPALKARAQTALDAGTALRADLFGLLTDPATASPFVPTATSAAGTAIASRVSDLQTSLANDFGVAGFTTGVALPAGPISGDELVGFIRDPTGPIALRTGDSKVTFRGDAEAGLALTLADRWDRGPRPGGFRAAVDGRVRFPTGSVARPDRLFALGTGAGHTDLELRVTTDLGAGRWGVRVEGLYDRQLAADYLVRVAPPTQPLAGIDLLSAVRLNPGDIVSAAVRPFFRLAPTIAIQGSAMHWSRGADEVGYLTNADSIPGVAASVVAQDSKASATVLGIGLTYSNPGRLRAGGSGLPIDASWVYERVVTASGGIVPDRHRVRASFRAYFGLF
jgi:hypothetical protein